MTINISKLSKNNNIVLHFSESENITVFVHIACFEILIYKYIYKYHHLFLFTSCLAFSIKALIHVNERISNWGCARFKLFSPLSRGL